jgi:hypothetical protein
MPTHNSRPVSGLSNEPGRSTSHRVSRPCAVGLQALIHPINPSCDGGRLLGSSGSPRSVTTPASRSASAMIGRAQHEMAAMLTPSPDRSLLEACSCGTGRPWCLHPPAQHLHVFQFPPPSGGQTCRGVCATAPGKEAAPRNAPVDSTVAKFSSLVALWAHQLRFGPCPRPATTMRPCDSAQGAPHGPMSSR